MTDEEKSLQRTRELRTQMAASAQSSAGDSVETIRAKMLLGSASTAKPLPKPPSPPGYHAYTPLHVSPVASTANPHFAPPRAAVPPPAAPEKLPRVAPPIYRPSGEMGPKGFAPNITASKEAKAVPPTPRVAYKPPFAVNLPVYTPPAPKPSYSLGAAKPTVYAKPVLPGSIVSYTPIVPRIPVKPVYTPPVPTANPRVAPKPAPTPIYRPSAETGVDGFAPAPYVDPATVMSTPAALGYGTEKVLAAGLGTLEAIGDVAGLGLYGAGKFITSEGGLVSNPYSEWFDERLNNALSSDPIHSPTQAYLQSIDRRYKPNELEQKAGGAVNFIAGMLPAMSGGAAVAAIANTDKLTGLGKLAAKAAPYAGKLIMGLTAAGQGATEAYSEGASVGKAALYGLGSGTLEASIESIAGGIPGLPKGVATEFVKKLSSSPIVNSLIDIAGEGGEEALSTIVTPFLKRAVYDTSAPNATATEIAGSAVMGMAAAGILQGATGNLDLRLRGSRDMQMTGAENAQTENMLNPEEVKAQRRAGLKTKDITSSTSGLPGNPGAASRGNAFDTNIAQPEESVNTDLQNFSLQSPEMQKIISEYQNSVDDGILDYVESVRNNQVDPKTTFQLGTMSTKGAQDISDMVGFDTTGYKVSLNPAAVTHIDKRHGINGAQDHSMANTEDLARIRYVLANYDGVVLDKEKSTAFTDSNGKAAAKVVYQKRVNGNYYVVEAVPDSKAKTLYIVTAYKSKANKKVGMPPADAISPPITSETATATPTETNIAQPQTGVNSHSVQDTMKNPDDASPAARKISELSQRMGVPVVFEDALIGNGRYQDGTIYINRSSKTPIKDTFIHELTHHIEGGGLYNDFANSVMDSGFFRSTLTEQGMTAAQYKQSIRDSYAQSGVELDDMGVDREIVAKFAEKYLSDEKTIARLAETNPTLFTRIKNWISDMITRFTGTSEEKSLVKMRQLYSKAAKNASGGASGGAQMSVHTDAQGHPFVVVEDDILNGVPQSEWVKTVKSTLKSKFPNGVDVSGKNVGVNLISRDEFTNSRYTQKLRRSDGVMYADKYRMASNMDEVLQASQNFTEESPKHTRKDSITGFKRGSIDVVVGANGYSADVITAVTSSGKEILYDVINFSPQKAKEATPSAYPQKMQSAQDDVASPDTNIAQPQTGVNSQSMQNPPKNPQHSLNPVEIGKLTREAANTTPPLEKQPRVAGDKKSKFAKSIKKQSIYDEHFKELAASDKFIQKYSGITNKQTLAQANAAIDDGGEAYVNQWYAKKEDFTAEDVAAGFILMDRYQHVGDYDSMVNAAEQLRTIGTAAGQTVQAFAIMGKMTPEGMAYYSQKTLSKAFEKMVNGRSKQWIDQNADSFKLSEDDMEFIRRRTLQAAELPEGRDKLILLGEISGRIQDKIPPTQGQAMKAFARVSMLLNPKTNVRNVLGNVTVAPLHLVSDVIGTAADKLISSKTGVRTTGLPTATLPSIKKGFYESFDDFRRGISTRDMSGDRFELGDGGPSFNEHAKGFLAAPRNALGKSLNALDRVTSFLLDAGDRPFFESWFTNSINSQMKLNGAAEPTPDMIAIATTEALQRTWQDSNSYTGFVSSVRKGLNRVNVKGYGLGDVVLPFIKTPANLKKALVDFSPIGLTKAIASDSILFKNAVQNGKATPQMQKAFVKGLSQGITGTLLYAIFAGLANAGMITGEGDKDRDAANFMRNVMGEQPYSVKYRDKTYSYGWAQPIAGMAAITADVVNSLKTGKPHQYIAGEDDATRYINAILSAIQSGGNVLYEQSFLQGIQNLFSQDNVIKGFVDGVLSEPSKFTPQFLAQIAQMQDDTVRVSYVYNQPVQTAINKVKAKLPGLSQTLEPAVDAFGRDVKRSGGDNSAFNVFFNPANVAKENRTPSADEVYRLYKATGDAAVIPPTAPYYFKVDGEKLIMSNKQKTEYQRATGRIAEKEIAELLKSPAYGKLDDEGKAEIIKDVYSYATDLARSKISGRQLDGVNRKILYAQNADVTPQKYLTIKAEADADGNGSITQEEMKSALDGTELTNDQRKYLYGLEGWKTNPYAGETTDGLAGVTTEKPGGKTKVSKVVGISDARFTEYDKVIGGFKAEYYSGSKNEVTASRKQKVYDYVESLPLTAKQKIGLYTQYYDDLGRVIIRGRKMPNGHKSW